MLTTNWNKDIKSIPNMLSLFRLLLIPVYIIIYLNAQSTTDYFLAATILAVSCLTDLIDGKIARHFHMITTLGKILDPLADKATQLALIICLAIKRPFLRYLLVLFVVKESFQLIAGGINLRRGKMLKGALLSGKICTTVLFISLIIMVMIPDLHTNAVNIITTVDIIFMTISFGNYLHTYFHNESNFQSLNLPSDE